MSGPLDNLESPEATLGADLTAIEALTGDGLLARTAENTWALRDVTGTADRITVTNGDGVSGNPTLTIASTYPGQTSITTLGTVATGTWQGTAVGVGYGGTGLSSIGAANRVLGMNSAGTLAEYKDVLGTSNQVSVTHGANSITLSTPQNIHTGASPTFAGLTLSGAIVGAASQSVFNTVSTTVNAFGAATTLNIGNTGGTNTVLGATTFSQTLQQGSGSGASAGLVIDYYGVSGYAGLWTTTVGSRTTSNYLLASNGAVSAMNGSTNSQLRVGGSIIADATSTGLAVNGTGSFTGWITPGASAKAAIRLVSVGTYYGKIQNDAADEWSLAYGSANNDTLGTSVLKWTPSGVAVTGNATITGTLGVTGQAQANKVASDTFSSTNAGFRVFDSALGAGLWMQQKLSSPYTFQIQAADSTFGAQFPLSLNPLGGVVNIASSGVATNVLGTLYNTGHGTTASAANTYIDSGTGLISRSTSSLEYKKDVEYMSLDKALRLLDLVPIKYHSKSPLDNPYWSYYGLGAEDVAKIDPRYVHWKVSPDGNDIKPDAVQYDRLTAPLIVLLKQLIAVNNLKLE